MKARLPRSYTSGVNNIQQLARQAQKLQEDMKAKQEEMEAASHTVTAGGGMVSVKINGKKEVLAITIKPEAVDPDDVEMLQDLIVAAVNEAMRKATEDAASSMSRLTGGLNLPF